MKEKDKKKDEYGMRESIADINERVLTTVMVAVSATVLIVVLTLVANGW